MQQNTALLELREQVDEVNKQIVSLLNKRAVLAVQIGKAKAGGTIYDPVREQQVLNAVVGQNNGPLSDDALRSIFQEIIAACRAIQQQN